MSITQENVRIHVRTTRKVWILSLCKLSFLLRILKRQSSSMEFKIFFFFLVKKIPNWHNDMSFLMDVFQPQKTGVDQIFLWEFFRRPSETKMSSFEVILRPKNIRPAAWFQKMKNTKLKKKMSNESNPGACIYIDGVQTKKQTLAPNFQVISFRPESTLATGRAFDGNGKEFLYPKSKPRLVKFFNKTSNKVHSRVCSYSSVFKHWCRRLGN